MKTIKLFATITAVMLASFAAETEASFYETNNTHDSLTVVNQGQWDSAAHSLANLFNTYFADVLNGVTYSTSQDLYNAIGVKSPVDSWYIGEDAQIISAFKAAAFQQTLYLTDSASGNAAYNTVFDGNIFDIFEGESHSNYLNLDPGQYNFSLGIGAGDHLYTLDGQVADKNGDAMIHMIAFDVTELMQQKFGNEFITSAYLFGWEDMLISSGADFDYQDLAYIMVNVSPGTPTSTPEPATIAIIALATAGIPVLRKKMRKKNGNIARSN